MRRGLRVMNCEDRESDGFWTIIKQPRSLVLRELPIGILSKETIKCAFVDQLVDEIADLLLARLERAGLDFGVAFELLANVARVHP